MLFCGGIITLVVTMLFGMMKGSKPYTYSLATAKANTEVQAALGTPIEAGFLVGGNIVLNNANGNANLIYEITGPNGSGTVHVVGDLSGGQWTYSTLDVTIKGTSNQIDLLQAP